MSNSQRAAAVIRTPDQRLRVFVSSTLSELADERSAVSAAISSLHLTPVMFELGARPHPPQELYRAYLEQSDIFIGLYWERYGWIGPGMEISGLEDELVLSRGMPRLLYLKQPAPEIEPRLEEMLDLVRAEGTDSYRSFTTPEELDELVRNDLAVLLSERFAASSDPHGIQPARGPRPLPVETTSLIGREQAIDEIAALFEHSDARLVTLTGPGGIGKTRLAVAVGERLRGRFPAGTVFVPLAAVSEPDLVVPDIARAAGADLTGSGSPLDLLIEHLGDAPWLLILDNFEQVVDAARDLDDLLARCPGVTILASSRTVLRLRAEREHPVPPLTAPVDHEVMSLDELARAPAVALFLDRARAVRPTFALEDGNAAAIVDICRRLEGVPLAIELAAARIRMLEPDALLARLGRSLDALGTGTVDMPERQRTLRATVEWSVGLLDESECSLLETVAVFSGGWTEEASAAVADIDEDLALDLSESLARHSLLHLELTEVGPRLRMLDTVREFVAERLAARSDVATIERRHAEHYRGLAERADLGLRGAAQARWADRLEAEASNLAAAVRWYLANDIDPLPHLFRVLWFFWTMRDHTREGRSWIEQVLPSAHSFDTQAQAELAWVAAVTASEVGDEDEVRAAHERLGPLLDQIEDPYLYAVALIGMIWTDQVLNGAFDAPLRRAEESVERFRELHETTWLAISLCSLAEGEIGVGRFDDAAARVDEASRLADDLDNPWLSAYVRATHGGLNVARGRYDEARALLDESLQFSLGAHSTNILTQCLGGHAWLAFGEGDAEQAALMAGAVEGLRERVGIRAWPMQREAEAVMQGHLREVLGSEAFEKTFATGRQLNRRQAVAAARAGSSRLY